MADRAFHDSRIGSGALHGPVEMPTHLIPCSLCSWSVVRPAPGTGSISRLSYASSLCPHLRTNHEPAGRANA